MSHSSFFHDDSPSDSPVEQYHERSQPSGPGEMASTASNQTPLRPDFSRHDSPFDTPSRKQRRASGAHAERNYSPPRSSRRPGSRLSLRSAHHEVPDEDSKPLEPVLVHLRTNVVVKDEFKLVMGLSSTLSQLYACSKDAIMINVDHSVCLMLGTSFDPAYFLHIQTLPAHLDPDSNVLATSDLQLLLHRHLKVPSPRGIVRFQPISPDFVSTQGTTFSQLARPPPAPVPARAQSAQPPAAPRAEILVNPAIPPSDSANNVLLGQIETMSQAGSVRGVSPAAPPSRRAYSPTKDWHGPASARRYRSENLGRSEEDDTGYSDETDSEAESAAEPPPAIARAREAGGSKRRSFFGILGR